MGNRVMDMMDSVTEWHEVLPEFPDEDYPHTSQEYREWISAEVPIDLCDPMITSMSREDFDRL
jgi:hypothetical protein